MARLYARDDHCKTLGKEEVMKKQFKTTVICVICVSVIFTAGAIAKELSVLERAKTVDDRELGELIRIAIENLQETNALKRMSGRRLSGTGDKRTEAENEHKKLMIELQGAEEAARAKVIKSVTEVYAQIKLLDTQIDQVRTKMDSLSKSEAIYTELTLAIAELQANRSTQLAQLRQIMNIVPKYAFGHKPANTLNGWLVLDVISDEIYAFRVLRPFGEYDSIKENPRYTRRSSAEIINKMSKKEAIEYIKNYIKDKSKHPFRIDITKNTAGTKLSEELYGDIVRTIKAEKLELESVVYLHSNVHDMSKYTSYFREGKIYNGRNDPRRRMGNYADSEQEHIDGFVSKLKEPKYLPLRHVLEFDEESEELANSIEGAILLKAKEFKVEKLVEIKRVLCFDFYVDGHRIYKLGVDGRKSNDGNFTDEEKFIKEIVPEQLKKVKTLPIKYNISGSNGTGRARVKDAIEAAVKEASLEDMVEVK